MNEKVLLSWVALNELTQYPIRNCSANLLFPLHIDFNSQKHRMDIKLESNDSISLEKVFK